MYLNIKLPLRVVFLPYERFNAAICHVRVQNWSRSCSQLELSRLILHSCFYLRKQNCLHKDLVWIKTAAFLQMYQFEVKNHPSSEVWPTAFKDLTMLLWNFPTCYEKYLFLITKCYFWYNIFTCIPSKYTKSFSI